MMGVVDEKKTNQLTLAERLRRIIQGMIKIRRGSAIDSGAADHVMPIGWFAWTLIVASVGSLRGPHHVAASGTRLPNMGPQVVRFLAENGTWASLTFEVAGIHKPLGSCSTSIDDGWRVVSDDEASYIKHKKTGRTIELKRERGVLVSDVSVEPSNDKIDLIQRHHDKH